MTPASAARRPRFALAVVVLLAAPAAAQPLEERMLRAEDARVATARALAPLLEGLRSEETRFVVRAVRALGRFERPDLVKHILPLAAHPQAAVRAEAINALGQAHASLPRGTDAAPLPPEAAAVSQLLLARLRSEHDPHVAGVVAETLGRLPYRTVDAVVEAEEALASLLPAAEGEAPRAATEPAGRVIHPASLAGVVKGMETLIRVHAKLHGPLPRTIARLRAAAMLGFDPSDADLAFIRRVAWTAVNTARTADGTLIERGFEDPDAQVRRQAVLALREPQAWHDARAGAAASGPDAWRRALLRRALADASPLVRYDAVRVYSRMYQAEDCAPVLAAVDDPSAHVALAAIQALGEGCPGAAARLAALADEIPGAEWHRAAHAFVSLARVAREQATPRLPRFAEHPLWQVRMYGARAATIMAAAARLERLASDPNDNVREAAIAGLSTLRGHEADALYIDALGRSDYQLVLTAARALGGSPDGGRAAPALVAAFLRLTAEGRDTSRDSRLALLERLRELGTKEHAGALRTCLSDFDAAVAGACAATLNAWTGATHPITPRTRPGPPPVYPSETRARITMAGGGSFDLRLFADDAPATVARFVSLARKGYYNGLTFHRVIPNFVVQGGSPGANEYAGDGPFMRDEVGLQSHARGAVGISTRGRDTGDAQIFVNLVDNPRFDHTYTVFAEVAAGMDVVDAILEGDVIERVDVLEPSSRQSRR